MDHDRDVVAGADELCAQCGHPWNPHTVFGYGDPPTEGWIECPVEGCTCRMTWSVPPEAADDDDRTSEHG
jgi:hypothetical protein